MNTSLVSDAGLPRNPSPLRRIYAMVMRYWYLLRGSWPRLFELLYWPTIQVCLWGLISNFLRTNSSFVAQAGGVLIAGVLLWDVIFRSQLGVAICFMEEMWSRNLGHLFVSPLRPAEWLISMMLTSVIRVSIGVLPAMLIAIPLYHYSIFDMGIPLIAFFVALVIMGWWLSLFIISLILRYGLGAESLAWMATFILAPVSAVYYPVASMPHWLQIIAKALPSSYIFEGMRTALFKNIFDTHLFLMAMALNTVYFAIGGLAFALSFKIARKRGALLQAGE